ncbi:hypothetical protein FHS15_001384 [Paenibacillus castaneae]|uniref:hypothetical protein n=1 Tax=Paenibacillus castaneae TaxID=474957 RepID=UPI000C9BDA5A|nr:hypothetical protein [Paenibacillus castaneae]NIK76277.1 hypothetical protein [Paenibacillus castaneae]
MQSFETFIIISKHRMCDHYLPKLRICLMSLTEDQLWHGHDARQNSIGGIILHIMEHTDRNSERIMNPGKIFGQGIERYFPTRDMKIAELITELEASFHRFAAALDDSGEAADMYNVYHLVEHTGYHLGQIVDRSQAMSSKRFEFVQNGINEKALRIIVERSIKPI